MYDAENETMFTHWVFLSIFTNFFLRNPQCGMFINLTCVAGNFVTKALNLCIHNRKDCFQGGKGHVAAGMFVIVIMIFTYLEPPIIHYGICVSNNSCCGIWAH